MIETKNYHRGNSMWINPITFNKIKDNILGLNLLKIRYELKTMSDFNIMLVDEFPFDTIGFYVEKKDKAIIKTYSLDEIYKGGK